MSEKEAVADSTPEAVTRVREELLGDSLSLDREVERFDAIGERTRFIILYLLAEEGRLRSGDLAELLDRRQNDLYHHLNTLEDAGLIGKFREGGSRVYELSPLAKRFVPDLLDAIADRGSPV